MLVSQFTLGGVDEVGRDVAAVELHALDDLHLVVQRLAVLDGDDALLPHLLHGVGDLEYFNLNSRFFLLFKSF